MSEALQHVLVVDDEAGMRVALEANFMRRGWQVETASGAADAVTKFRRARHSLVVTDVRMPDGDGLGVMREVRALAPATPVILLTGYGNIPDAVSAMKGGACDYLVKPVSFEQLAGAAQRVLGENPAPLRFTKPPAESTLVGSSPQLRRALERARQAAESDADVLIEAESGTGKELLARLIHRSSPRRHRPLIAVNCAAFPETLLESELFGHVRGAFTGAATAKPGKFELANRGTLLLDEVGEMPLSLQPKLLRAVQEREVDRLGDTRSLAVDIRVIATSNRSLHTLVSEGAFRADLYYRLNVIPLTLAPLRERRQDIAELAIHFAQLYASSGVRRSSGAPALTTEFLAALGEYSWPGNVRELANCMRRVLALNPEGEIGIAALADAGLNSGLPPASAAIAAVASLRETEKRLLESTLDATGGNRSRAAEMMGVSLRTIRNKIRQYGLPPRRFYEQHG